MPLPPPRPRDPRVVVVAAVAFGVVSVVLMVVLIGAEIIKGDRPEEEAAATFLTALFHGRGAEVHDLTTPRYRTVVFEDDLAALSRALHATAGDTDVEVLGSERTPDSQPLESYVGYQGSSEVGTVEGVVVVIEIEPGRWLVRDVSYRFPEASRAQTAELFALTRTLNAQVAERLGRSGP